MQGHLIKTDVFEALLDHETKEEVLQKAKDNKDFNPTMFLRYCVINTSLLLVGLTAKNAAPMKPYLGSTSYTVSCIRELIRHVEGVYDIEFDNGVHRVNNLRTQYLQIYNGKFGGGRIILNPLGLINDGYMELVYRPGLFNAAFAIYMFCLPGGVMCYDEGFTCFRAKQAKIINKMKDKDGNMIEQDINIDGEDLTFKNFAKYTVLPSCIDIIVDMKHILKETYLSHLNK